MAQQTSKSTKQAPKEPKPAEAAPKDQAAEDLEALKRSEAAKKAAVTRAANERRDAATLALYGHLRHTLGAEVSIDHARQIVETVEKALTPPEEGE